MSVSSKKVKTNISRVRSVLSSLDNNSVKVIRYNIPKSQRVTFRNDILNNESEFSLPHCVPEDISIQNEIDQTSISNKLLRRNRKPFKRIKKLPGRKIQETRNTNTRLQELQDVKAEIDKMENKLISKRKETLKEFNKNLSRPKQVSNVKKKINLNKIDTITQTEVNDDYDPNDYTEQGDFTSASYSNIRNDEDLFIKELKEKSIISDKLPFELGTKISPNDKNAVIKLRTQLNKWRQPNADNSSTSLIEEEPKTTMELLGNIIREEPERDGSPFRSNNETTEKSASSSSDNKNYPLDDYIKIKVENLRDPPRRKLENIDGLILLQTKVATLGKEADKQLETPLIKPLDPALKCQVNSSESSESGQTEELVEAVFNETTFNKDLPLCCAHDCAHKHYQEKYGTPKYFSRFAANVGENSPSNVAPKLFNEGKKLTASQSYSLLSQSTNTNVCRHNNFEQSQLPYEPSEIQKVHFPSQNVKVKSNFNTAKETISKPQKQNVHWSSTLEHEYSKLATINSSKSSFKDPKSSILRRKTHDVSINTDNPKVNAKFIHIIGKDADDDRNKPLKKVFSIQELPGVNIRPPLTKQSCPNINIICSEKLSKPNNIAILNMCHDDDERRDQSSDVAQNQPSNITQNQPELTIAPKQTTSKKPLCINCRIRKGVDKSTFNRCDKEDKNVKNNPVEKYRRKEFVTKGKKTEYFDKDKLFKDIHFLKNITSYNKSFRDALKNFESTVGELLEQQLQNSSGEKQLLLNSKQYHISELPKRLNVVADLLQDAVYSFDSYDDQKVDNLIAIIQLLSHDIKYVLDECKRKAELVKETSDGDESTANDSTSVPSNIKGYLQEGASTSKKIEYIPYRKLYPGKGANALEAAGNEKEKDLRLTRLKKFYEINRDLYNLNSYSPVNDGNTADKIITEEEVQEGNNARPLNETFIIENEQTAVGDNNKYDSPPSADEEVEYEEDWEEDDESEDEGSIHFPHTSQNNELKRNDTKLFTSEKEKLQGDVTTFGKCSDQREKKSTEEVIEDCKLESKVPTCSGNSEGDASKKPGNKNEISFLNVEKSQGLTSNVNRNEPSVSNSNLDKNNKNTSYPFFKLTNPQTKSLVEIRLPENHNTFKSSLTVSSCPEKDEIKLLYDRGNGQICGSEIMPASDVAENLLKQLDNKPNDNKEEITSENQDQKAGGSKNVNVNSFERISANFMEFLEEKVREFFDIHYQPLESIKNKEIKTDKNEMVDQFINEKLNDKITGRLSNNLPPYQSETISFKSSVLNSSEKISEPRGTFTDLLIPSLDHIPLSVPQGSLDTNLSSNISRNEVIHIPEVANFLVDKKVDNENANYDEDLNCSFETRSKSDNEQNLQRLLPSPQTFISDVSTLQNNVENCHLEGLPDDRNSEHVVGDMATADVETDNPLIIKGAARLLPLPSDVNSLSDYNSHNYDDNGCLIDEVKCDSSLSNQSKDPDSSLSNQSRHPDIQDVNDIPTDILPSPSILNSFTGTCQPPVTRRFSHQDISNDSDNDSSISCEKFKIYYFNTDEMSDGEIGFVYTSNTYSSGEVKPRSSSSASSLAHSLSEDGKKCNKQMELNAAKISSTSKLDEFRKYRDMNPSFSRSAFLNSSDADFHRSLRQLEILERNISVQSDSTTTESTTSESSSSKT